MHGRKVNSLVGHVHDHAKNLYEIDLYVGTFTCKVFFGLSVNPRDVEPK
jgi:hypothetical protein